MDLVCSLSIMESIEINLTAVSPGYAAPNLLACTVAIRCRMFSLQRNQNRGTHKSTSCRWPKPKCSPPCRRDDVRAIDRRARAPRGSKRSSIVEPEKTVEKNRFKLGLPDAGPSSSTVNHEMPHELNSHVCISAITHGHFHHVAKPRRMRSGGLRTTLIAGAIQEE